jgi:hypothetical protein
VALRSRRPAVLGRAAAGAAAYAARPFRRARRRWSAGRPGDAVAEAVGVPAMMAFIDAAKMWGYVDGLVARYLGRID